jgi:hypothetical protein
MRRAALQRTEAAATTYCVNASRAIAVRPSRRETSRESAMVASVDPNATVTTRSKALSFERALSAESQDPDQGDVGEEPHSRDAKDVVPGIEEHCRTSLIERWMN